MSQREQNNRSNNNNSAYGSANQRPRESRGGDHRNDIESSSVHTDFRVMRCFCGCTALTYEQIEHFAMMNVSTLIQHSTGKTLFQNFLRIGHRHDKSEAMIHLECYEMCDKFLRNSQLYEDQDLIDHLLSLCPTYTWEQRITDTLENNSGDHRYHRIRHVLNDLKRECVHSIECHNDYDRFRRELLRKIGRT
ncbi:uncharacterized protein LOC116338250 [Contarinia nasturtii]|uniref:uncharacterized protein LOC116338250 n=1 Tax=Contarinia nasturtii TaxID=265458 RepID=UPI0012D4354C|nr:uncharacterized protein LOC116338250 [Contarinia nasturtii]